MSPRYRVTRFILKTHTGCVVSSLTHESLRLRNSGWRLLSLSHCFPLEIKAHFKTLFFFLLFSESTGLHAKPVFIQMSLPWASRGWRPKPWGLEEVKMPHGPLHHRQCASSGHPERRITKKCRGLASNGWLRWCWLGWSAAPSSSASISSTFRPSSSAPGRRSAMLAAERASTATRWTLRSALWCCRTRTSSEPSEDTGLTSWGGNNSFACILIYICPPSVRLCPGLCRSDL